MISIHTALAGCDSLAPHAIMTGVTFQSTQPSQTVTVWYGTMPLVLCISIHTTLAGCDCGAGHTGTCRVHISIHTALAGCDAWSAAFRRCCSISIHTALAGCDYDSKCLVRILWSISIHTALAGCDGSSCNPPSFPSYFNPHSPRRL